MCFLWALRSPGTEPHTHLVRDGHVAQARPHLHTVLPHIKAQPELVHACVREDRRRATPRSTHPALVWHDQLQGARAGQGVMGGMPSGMGLHGARRRAPSLGKQVARPMQHAPPAAASRRPGAWRGLRAWRAAEAAAAGWGCRLAVRAAAPAHRHGRSCWLPGGTVGMKQGGCPACASY